MWGGGYVRHWREGLTDWRTVRSWRVVSSQTCMTCLAHVRSAAWLAGSGLPEGGQKYHPRFSTFTHDHHMTTMHCSRSHDHMILTACRSHDCHMTTACGSHDCHMTVTWPLHVGHMTVTWPLHVVTWLSHDASPSWHSQGIGPMLWWTVAHTGSRISLLQLMGCVCAMLMDKLWSC